MKYGTGFTIDKTQQIENKEDCRVTTVCILGEYKVEAFSSSPYRNCTML